MPSGGHGKRRRGTPLTEVAETSNGVGRAVNWRVQRADHEAFHALADARGISASELAREFVDAAAEATGRAAPVTGDHIYLSARLSHSQIAAMNAAAGASELDPTVWLRLMTTSAGDVLLRQLQAAKKTREAR